jgi:hypothetical protein
LLLGAGVCPNPNVTSRTGTTIRRNAFLIESSYRSSP